MTPETTPRSDARAFPSFVCPCCRGNLESSHSAHSCSACSKSFPILHGIPDFRLRSDAYLSLDEERAKAERLEAQSKLSFAELLEYYYSITDDVPPALAKRYRAYHEHAPRLAEHALQGLELQPGQLLLDVGCGSGGALLAAARLGARPLGVDIAMRWLVICKRRLAENGVEACLVCADAEALPFADGSFPRLLAADLLENVHATKPALESLARAMQPGALMWLTGTNRYCLGPHATTRLWALGFFPARLRRALLMRLRGVDSLRFSRLITPLGVRAMARDLGLDCQQLAPKKITLAGSEHYSWLEQRLLSVVGILGQLPLFRQLLLVLGPSFEMQLRKHVSRK